jgi:blue copper oxidase
MLVGTEAGRLNAPIELRKLRIAPAERVDVLVNFSDAAKVMLSSLPDSNAEMSRGPLRQIKDTLNSVSGQRFPVLEFRPTRSMKEAFKKFPTKLNGAPDEKQRSISVTRDFVLDMTGASSKSVSSSSMSGMNMQTPGLNVDITINGRPFDMARNDFNVKVGSTEKWRVSSTMMAHPFHIHGCRFKILTENGTTPLEQNTGWKDVVLVEGTVELLAEFENVASASTPYMYHCHILEHEDAGMMGQFTVT